MTERPDMETIPFVGELIKADLPAMSKDEMEVRRRDVGVQRYGSGTPKQNGSILDVWGHIDKKQKVVHTNAATMVGDVALGASKPNLGYLPTAADVDFLSRTLGTRRLDPPLRYFK